MKRSVHISGSSLLEAVIAIAIISFCLTIGLSTFVRVTNVQPPVDYYTMDSKLKQSIAIHTDTLGLLKTKESGLSINHQNGSLDYSSNGLNLQSLVIIHKTDTLRFDLFEFKKIER